MNIQILSDLHVELAAFDRPRSGTAPDVVILAGDIHSPGSKVPRWARRDSVFGAGPEIVFVPGNHEFYGTVLEDEMASLAAECEEHRVTLLQCSERVIGDVRFLGCTLWTDFALAGDVGMAIEHAGKCMNDYRRIERRAAPRLAKPRKDGPLSPPRTWPIVQLTPADTLALHWQHRSWLKRTLAVPVAPEVRATVVVTHHAPSARSVPKQYTGHELSPAYASEILDEVLASAQQVPALWIHGHIHQSIDYLHESGCRVTANPRGYLQRRAKGSENTKFDRERFVEV